MDDSQAMFKILRYLDEPKRILGLTIDEASIGGVTIFLLMLCSHKFVVGILGAALYICLKYLKKGRYPSYLILLAYWHFPHQVMRFILPKLPKSHLRYWAG